MSEYKLNASFEVVGGFWRPSSPDDVITGTLASTNGRASLAVSPSLNRPIVDASRDAFAAFCGTYISQAIPCLNGYTRDGECTLFGLREDNGAGVTDFGRNVQIVADRWRVFSIVMGLHIESAEQAALEGAAFYFSKIHHLLPMPFQIEWNQGATLYSAPHEALQVFRFDSAALGAEVICEVFATGSTKRKNGTVLRPMPRFRIMPKEQRSLEWFINLGQRLENFCTLLMGTSVSLKRAQLFSGDEQGWFVRQNPKAAEKVKYEAWLKCGFDAVVQALETWFSVPEEKRQVEKNVLQMLRRSKLFEETKFLALAQATEGFGRIRFSDKINFRESLEQSYDLLGPDLASKVFGERPLFVQQALQTRNYFTHLGGRKGAAVITDGKELFLFNQRLQALLRGVLLLDLGFDADTIKDPILYQARRWS